MTFHLLEFFENDLVELIVISLIYPFINCSMYTFSGITYTSSKFSLRNADLIHSSWFRTKMCSRLDQHYIDGKITQGQPFYWSTHILEEVWFLRKFGITINPHAFKVPLIIGDNFSNFKNIRKQNIFYWQNISESESSIIDGKDLRALCIIRFLRLT